MKAQLSVGWLDYDSEDESPLERPWSEELERVPLKQRLKMLRAKASSKNRNDTLIPAISQAGDTVNKENVLCDSMDFYPDQDGGEGRPGSASCKQRQNGIVHTIRSSTFQDRMISERLERECNVTQDDYVTNFPNGHHPSNSDDIENSLYFNEDLEHVPLKERQRMLLSRELVRPTRPVLEFISPDLSTSPAGFSSQNSRLGSDICGVRSTVAENFIFEKASSKALKHGSLNGVAAGISTWTNQRKGTTRIKSQNFKNVCKEAITCSSGTSDIDDEMRFLSSFCYDPFQNVKVETPDDDVKIPNRSICKQIAVKDEAIHNPESLEDITDHMMLGDRIRLLAQRKFPKTTAFEKLETGNDHKSKLSKSCMPLAIKRPRKRRRTATDSVETALEEDAPGLLKVLIEKGVLVDEIKLYGANEGDEPLDESLVEESFSDLEDVITKIFSQQQSLFKFAPIRCGKGEKTTYCLACLISLVEQARYLRVRKWPVEWGWCRDLQSFIFVFNKHNRIVLERPEYGYATYFFELIDSLPVNWQIKRLITAMKLTSCSRITLIENRALRVGDDLTEGEAQVLMEFGWIPNSGLGTMLNYCDRVVHDRKNDSESDSSEWRSKIGKLLTDGYNGGIIVPNDIPKRVMEYGIGHTPEIKLEY